MSSESSLLKENNLKEEMILPNKKAEQENHNYEQNSNAPMGTHLVELDPYSRKEARKILEEQFDIKQEPIKRFILNLFRRKVNISELNPFLKTLFYLFEIDAFSNAGITRLNGSIKRSKIAQNKLKHEENIDYSQFSPYELVNAIKSFIFEDRDGLLNYEAADALINSNPKKLEDNSAVFMKCMVGVSNDTDGYFLIVGFKLFGFIAKLEEKTKMNSRALAVIFVPIILGKSRMKKIDLKTIDLLIKKFEKLIDIFV